jgi:hypothetical protein
MAAGAGYNIPISLSVSESFSVPQTITAPTFFAFGGSQAGGDFQDTGSSSYAPSTATASAALGDSSAYTGEQGAGGFGQRLAGGLNPSTMLLVGGIAIAAIAAIGITIYLLKR